MSRALILCTLLTMPLSLIAVDNTSALEPSGYKSLPWSQAALKSQWQLTPQEIERLQQLAPMADPWTEVASLTPYELLGLYARDARERRGYAERFVAARVAHQRRTIDWTITVVESEASGAVDTSLDTPLTQAHLASRGVTLPLLGATQASTVPTPSERLHVFVTLEDCTRCSHVFINALDQVKQGRYGGVDVIFAEMTQENRRAATDWALAHDIKPSMIQQRTVTLNWESAAWQHERANRATPLVIRASTGEVLDAP